MKAIVFALGVALLLTCPATAAGHNAEAFVRTIYDTFTGPNAQGFDFNDAALVRRDFEPTLANAIIHSEDGLDADPFVNGSDWFFKTYTVNVVPRGANEAVATVSFDDFDQRPAMVAKLMLVRMNGQWKIRDIDDGNGDTFRQEYVR